MVPEWQLDNGIRGHTIIKTLTGEGEGNEEIFMIGGLASTDHLNPLPYVKQLIGDEFKYIASLKNGRAYHIALPISYDLAKESCKGPS